jgi:hypothetical protein
MRNKIVMILAALAWLHLYLAASETGFRVGLNLATVTAANGSAYQGLALDSTFSTTLTGGFFYRLGLLRWLSIQAEVLYSPQGHLEEGSEQINWVYDGMPHSQIHNVTTSTRIHYLQIPLQLKFQFTNSFYVSGGCYYSFRLGGQVKITDSRTNDGSSSSSTVNIYQALDSALRTEDLGFVVAGGLILDDDAGAFIELRYCQGFKGISSDPAAVVNKNSCLTLSLGFGL